MDRRAVRSQIDRLLSSAELREKEQLKKLLALLFERIDSQASLQPGRVIEELWPEQAETKRSSDLATEMSRLRRALAAYYEGPGREDEIVVRLPSRTTPASNGNKANRWITAEYRYDETREEMETAAIATPAPAVIAVVGPAVARPEKKQRWMKWWIPGLVGGLAAALAVAGYLGFGMVARPAEPQSARIDGSILTVMDGKGRELWRQTFAEGLWSEYYDRRLASLTWFGDLDGDGHTEVLFLDHPATSPHSRTTTLICYSDRGKERWRWTPGRALPEIAGSPATFQVVQLKVTKPDARGRRRIVVVSNHDPYYPNQIAVVDSNGRLMSDYWHSGHLDHMILADLDGDGREEIVATGISNGYRQATLAVLDLDHVSGASTEAARPEVQLHGMGTAQERVRLLFPRSDLNRALFMYNDALEATFEQGKLRVPVRECDVPTWCYVWYEFDAGFHLRSVTASDQLRSAHAAFYANQAGRHVFEQAEEAEFRKVRCLAGCPVEVARGR
jgi:hypothetical protein